MNIKVQHFYDKETYTLTYVVFDEITKDAVVIDPVLNYDQAASKISHKSIDQILEFTKSKQLHIHYILETHAHADHLTGAMELKKKIVGARVGIGKNITKVQSAFKDIFNLESLCTNGSQFDVLLKETIPLIAGTLEIKTIYTPGHTPACCSFLIGDNLFTGDTIFMPDYGTGRCDFPAGSAKDLYHSIHCKLYELPEKTKVFTGHDYQPNGRELKFVSTIGEQKTDNIQLKANTTEEEFVKFRTERDAKLSAPKLLLPSVQFNIDAGNMPKAENNGTSYFKIPIKE